jgi:Fic-DOC domain mobile mystery protein B
VSSSNTFGPDPDGATPLEDEDLEGLKPSWIVDRGDLNAAEADNIAAAIAKWERRSRPTETLLDDKVVRELHRDMYGDVWAWAGTYRTREMTIGVDPYTVSVELRNLVEDSKYWFAENSSMSLTEAAARFHHKLVFIHPFRNGNGRLARQMTDLLLVSRGRAPLTWGRTDLGQTGDARTSYLAALRAADRGDFDPLLRFLAN